MTEELDPKTFDIDAWLEDAHLPEESVRIYKRADLLGRITALQETIKEEAAADDGGTLASSIEYRKAVEEYEELLEKFGDSALTVYVSSVPSDKVRDIRKKVDKVHSKKLKDGANKADANEWRSAELVYAIMAAAIVAVAGPDGERRSVGMSIDGIKKLENSIGTGQFDALLTAKRKADGAVQEPDADFLHKLSGTSSQSDEDY